MNLDEKVNDIDCRLVKQETMMESANKKLDELGNVVHTIYNLTNSVEQMAKTQSNMVNEIKSMKQEINDIKNEPIQDMKEYKKAVIKDVIGFLVSLILGYLASKLI